MIFRGHVAVVLLLAGLAVSCQSSADRAGSGAPTGDVLLPRETDVFRARVPRDATLETLLVEQDLSPQFVLAMADAMRDTFSPRRLKAGNVYRVTRTLDGVFQRFRYEIDDDRYLRVVHRSTRPDGEPEFDVEVFEYPKEIVPGAAIAFVTENQPSLVQALDAAGENQLLALDLASVFSGLVDFQSELRVGDEVRVLYDRVLRNREFAGYERVRAAVLHNDGLTFTAIPFPQEDGSIGWYDADGRSLKRQFLKSPLPFATTISSGFSYRRLHPVSRTFSAHPAIDYRAPYGAQVVAVAEGTVTFAAWSGGSGRLVRIRHARGYETLYLHLSAFAPGIRSGVRVAQGQTIGRVGNSGNVTGTHLDFRLRKNGAYVNPLAEYRRMPPGDPIADDQLPAFIVARDVALGELDDRLASLARRANDPD